MRAISSERARRSRPVSGSIKSGRELPVTRIGPSFGMVRSNLGSRPRKVKVGGNIWRYFSTTAGGNLTICVSESTLQPCRVKRRALSRSAPAGRHFRESPARHRECAGLVPGSVASRIPSKSSLWLALIGLGVRFFGSLLLGIQAISGLFHQFATFMSNHFLLDRN